MPHDDDSQPFDGVVDDLVSEAGRTASGFDWAIRPSDILDTSRRSRSKHVREGVGVVLVAAVLVAIFVVPLPQLHLFRGGTSPPAGGLKQPYESLAISSDIVPSPRGGTVMAYFPPGNEVVLFGGWGSGGAGPSDYLNDTWVFDRHGWRELHPATSPPARGQAAMAYDPQLGEIVLYGGCSFCGAPGYALLQDTWAFDGSNWHELHSSRLPTYEPSPQLGWDTATSALELLAPPPGYGPNPPTGNFDANGSVSLGRWLWESSGWTWEGSAEGPPLVSQQPAFVSVPGSTDMLYYSYQPYSGTCIPRFPARPDCGSDPTGLTYSQTWTWNGRTFLKNHPVRAPRSSQLVVADTRVGHVVAVAGSEVWGWSGATWTVLSSDVPSTANVAAAYDPLLGDVVVFGETSTANASATSVWDGTTWHSVAAPLPARTGAVTGFIDPCEGIAIPGAPFAAGTVVVLRGKQTSRETAPGVYQVVLPSAVVGREHVGKDQPFDFELAPGSYVLVATFDTGGNARGMLDVHITGGTVLQQNIPNACK